ncbi:hypothetical protein EZ449_02810 [Pedobacter frigidisoli]|uniref:Uncharacterized protein n=1 Tax=Pedobacter frigidisoli TaxID=2530455 RepID=A0A4R0P860_9SPHI|nr:hypothetical protein [Pedobacter frigidisoli]RZJ92614.1 MAG: hypothetical protein EOO20_01075 [Chryseobacterium sp.]TCD12995.1 hypothetical protein EZ449_02810 [Pedobacter frigidisoli]
MKKLLILSALTISLISVRAQDKSKIIGPKELAALISSELKLQHSKADCLIILSCDDAAANTKAMKGETVQMFNNRATLMLSDCQGRAAGDFKTFRPKQQPIIEGLRNILKSKGPYLIDFKDQKLNMMIDLSKTN